MNRTNHKLKKVIKVMKVQLQATFNQDELDRIDRICKQEFIKRAALVRTAVMKYVVEMEKRESL